MFKSADAADDERVDQGSWISFTYDQLARYCNSMAAEIAKTRLSPSHLPLSSVPVFVRVVMEEVFKPATVPFNYDSKKATGMVGLENLGATCYLNALLQV
jgi:ubiquitin C-terminal hydrolase